MTTPSAETGRRSGESQHYEPLPVELITVNGMARWLGYSRTAVIIHLPRSEFVPELRPQPGVRGQPANHYTWKAFEHVAGVMLAPKPAVPIFWDELPASRQSCTSEQESYARAVQIMLLPPERRDIPRIMTHETAVHYLLAVAEVRQRL